MPEASEELRTEWGLSDAKAIDYLTTHGYRLLKGWVWQKPSLEHKMTAKEASAIRYLIEEWNFGGIKGDEP